MKKIHVFIICLILSSGFSALGQEGIFGGTEIVSPEIHEDDTVTFRFMAPEAKSVKLNGDFLPTKKKQTPMGDIDVPIDVEMTKGEDGTWSYTTKSLAPELYSYFFIVDSLKTTDPNNPFVIRDVSSVTNILLVGQGQADLYRVNDIPHGTVSKRWYDSPGLQMDRRITIYTPPGYEASENKYPVLYLLHGAGGDEEAWMELGRTSQIMDNLIAQGKIKPMIVVMPNGNVSQDAAPGMGSDGYFKPQFMAPQTMNGTYEANFHDIIRFTEANYRVKADKEHRAIAGLSMGGFHSYHISRFYPNTFDYVGLFSAAFMPREDASDKVYTDIDKGLKQQMDDGYKLYWIGIGKTDFLYKSNEEYRQKLDTMGMPYEYIETDGGHTWRNWRIYLSQFTTRLFQ